MKRTARWMFVGSIALVAAAVTGCASTYSEGDETESLATEQTSLILAKDCLAGPPRGRVGICHATGKRARPYVFERVKPNVCAGIHARHPGDFISSDPTCPVCGNGIVENGETCDPLSSCPTSCDDGNACTADQLSGSPTTCNATCSHTPISACAAGDSCCPTGCSSSNDSDCAPTCTPTSPIRKLTFNWLGRSCGATEPQDVVFTLNETEVARVPLTNSCDCTPGVGSVEVTNPALLALGVNGTNTFRVTTTGELSWGTVALETPTFGTEMPIWAAWPYPTWNDATAHPPNLCMVGVQAGLSLSGVATNLYGGTTCPPPNCTPTSPIRKLKFSWLGRSCGATQPQDVVFTLNEHEVARVPLANSCDCAPGVGNIEISDQALLAFGVNGTNTFRVTSAGELSWGTVALGTPEFGGEYTIWAAWPFENWNDATSHPADLCTVGVQDGLDLSGLAMNLVGGVSCN